MSYPYIHIYQLFYLASQRERRELLDIEKCFYFARLVPETPRWLLTKGREGEALAVLGKISKMNKRPLPDDLILQKPIIHERRISFLQLFRSWKVAKKVLICWDLW